MKRNFCTQCGAALNNKNTCDFCGSTYSELNSGNNEQIAKSKKTRDIPRLNDSDIGHVLKDLQPKKIAALPIIIFACIWCGGALIGGITMLSVGESITSIMALIPLGMCLFGIVMFIGVIRGIVGGGTKKILKLWKAEQYDETLRLCETKNSDNYKIAWALIAFHRYQRDDEAHQKLMLVSNSSLSSASSQSTAVSQLLQYFDITPTRILSSSSTSSVYINKR